MDPSTPQRSDPPGSESPATGREELDRYRAEFEEIGKRVRELIEPLDPLLLNRRPGPGRWSAGECIDHLVVIGNLLIPRMADAIRSGRASGLTGEGPFRPSWPARMFVESLQPDYRFRIKTLPLYVPGEKHEPEGLLRRFEGVHEGLFRCIGEAAGLDLIRIKVPSPANRLLRFGIGTWFAATAAHERRHYGQAARAVARQE